MLSKIKGITIERNAVDSELIKFIKDNDNIKVINIIDNTNADESSKVNIVYNKAELVNSEVVDTEANLEKRIANTISQFGIAPSVGGYGYLVEAIKIIIDNGVSKMEKSSKIYKQVGDKFGKSQNQVERCIRHAILRMCEICGVKAICSSLGFYNYQLSKSDTIRNLDFMYMAAEHIGNNSKDK